MKKFLIYLSVILVAVSLGFTVFYLTRNNEKIYISTSSVYMREGEEIDDLSIIWENKKAFSEYEVLSSNENIAAYDKTTGKLKAKSGGIATITFRTSSVKFRNLSCQVYVGDGSLNNPYYVTNADQLRQIGAYTTVGETTEIRYGLDECYKLVTNIDLLDGYNDTGFWIPIGTGNDNGFTGSFDGNGYTISNVSVDKARLVEELAALEGVDPGVTNYNTFVNAGLFSKVGINGRISNLKINNIIVHGAYENGYVGSVAGQNYGTIERVEVLNGHLDTTGAAAVGGITAVNISQDATIDPDGEGSQPAEYVRYTARIDRCAAQVTMGIAKSDIPEEQIVTGVAGNVGGIVGTNHGGIVIYSYSMGDVYLNKTSAVNFGGVVGVNATKMFATQDSKYLYNYAGAHVKDNYSLVVLKNGQETLTDATIGGIIGSSQDVPALDPEDNGITAEEAGSANKVVGNYYNKENLNFVETQPGVDPVVTVTYTGVGKHTVEGAVVAAADKDYFIQGKTSNELKLQTTYLSHKNVERVWNEDTQEYVTKEEIVGWKFDVVWFMKENIHNGYPYLNFANIEVEDDLIDLSDGRTIKTYEDLTKMKLDGNYVIAANIDAGNNIWIPIGNDKNPFVGSLKAGKYTKNGEEKYYTISNLKTTAATMDEAVLAEIPYAGLFGVTSGAKSGKIEDITLVNPYFVNGAITGGIVASNGTEHYTGSTISNCKVLGGELRGTVGVGGIAGYNYGTISGGLVSDSTDEYENVTKLNITLYSTAIGDCGGIVGWNHENATVAGSRVQGSVNIVAKSGQGKSATVNVGGIAGNNGGSLDSVVVNEIKGIAINSLKGNIGGIAGNNTKTINKALVNKTEIYAPTDNDQVYAGGIVGKAIGETKIETVMVKNGSVTGYHAGGFAGIINYSKPNYNYTFSATNSRSYSIGENDPNTIYNSGVVEFTVKGKLSGGFAAIIDNGIIRDCYTQAKLSGVDSGSTKAGFAVDINLNGKHVGIVVRSYASVTFADGNGSNYAVTTKEIYKDPIFDINVESLKRNAGYCLDFVYNKDSGGTEPDTGNVIKDLWNNWFDAAKLDSASAGEMQGTSPKKFTDRNFSTSVWLFKDGGYPELISLNAFVASC